MTQFGLERWKLVIYNRLLIYEAIIWLYLSNPDFLILPYQDGMISHIGAVLPDLSFQGMIFNYVSQSRVVVLHHLEQDSAEAAHHIL